MNQHHLDDAAALCALVGAASVQAWLGYSTRSDPDEVRAALTARRATLQGMRHNPKYREEADFVLKKFDALRYAVDHPDAHHADLKRRIHSTPPEPTLLLRPGLAEGPELATVEPPPMPSPIPPEDEAPGAPEVEVPEAEPDATEPDAPPGPTPARRWGAAEIATAVGAMGAVVVTGALLVWILAPLALRGAVASAEIDVVPPSPAPRDVVDAPPPATPPGGALAVTSPGAEVTTGSALAAPSVAEPPPRAVAVTLTSDPPGATVSRDGQPLGITPFTVHLGDDDAWLVHVAAPGYTPHPVLLLPAVPEPVIRLAKRRIPRTAAASPSATKAAGATPIDAAARPSLTLTGATGPVTLTAVAPGAMVVSAAGRSVWINPGAAVETPDADAILLTRAPPADAEAARTWGSTPVIARTTGADAPPSTAGPRALGPGETATIGADDRLTATAVGPSSYLLRADGQRVFIADDAFDTGDALAGGVDVVVFARRPDPTAAPTTAGCLRALSPGRVVLADPRPGEIEALARVLGAEAGILVLPGGGAGR